jgi:hypothetical protein
MAAAIVPLYTTLIPVFAPALIPLTTRSGCRGSSFATASFTQSAGRPSTAIPVNPFSTVTGLVSSGVVIVIPCPVALCTVSGATTCTSPSRTSSRYIATSPGALMPSSFVSRISMGRGV